MALLPLSQWTASGGLHSDICHFLKGRGGISLCSEEDNQKVRNVEIISFEKQPKENEGRGREERT